MEIDTIGIDLGKTVFHLVGLSAATACARTSCEPRPRQLWTSDGDRGRGLHWQRRRVPKRTLVCGMAGTGTGAALHRREAEAAGDQQAGKPLPAKTARARSPRRPAVQGQAVARPQCVARSTRSSCSHQHRGGRASSKMAGIVWAGLAKGEQYRPPLLASSVEAVVC